MKTLSILFIATLLLLPGCTSDEGAVLPTPGFPPVEDDVPLTVESASLEAEVTSRATPTLGAGSQIGVFLAGTGYTAINNRQYNYGSPAWVPQGGAGNTIYLGGATAQVCAYHPFTSSLTNSAAIPLTSQEYAAAKDISYAKNKAVDGTSSGKSVSFAMTRAYARIKFTVKRSNYSGKGDVTKLEVSNLLPSTTLNITSGAYAAAAGTTATTVSTTKTVTLATSAASDYADYLIVPCTPAGAGMTVKLTVDGQPMTTTLATAAYTPKAGEWKTINISVQGTEINVTSVTVEDWKTLSSSDIVPKP